jgi:hypothetical protein
MLATSTPVCPVTFAVAHGKGFRSQFLLPLRMVFVPALVTMQAQPMLPPLLP